MKRRHRLINQGGAQFPHPWAKISEDVSDTLDSTYENSVYFKDGTGAITLTLEASTSTDFSVEGYCQIINAGASGAITVTEGAGTTLFILTGSSTDVSGGSVTIAAGSEATLWREDATIYYIFGNGITPLAAMGSSISDFSLSLEHTSAFIGSAGGRGIGVKADETVLMIGDIVFNDIQQIDLSIAGDLTSDSDGGTITELDSNPFGMYVNPNGLELWHCNPTGPVHGTMSVAWDITTLSAGGDFDISQGNVVQGITWKDDGIKVYVTLTQSSGRIYEYTCSSAYDFSTRGTAVIFNCSGDVTSPAGIDFDATGTILYLASLSGSNKTIFQYTLSTPWDITSATFTGSKVFSSIGGIDYLHFVRATGTTIYGVRHGHDEIMKFTT